MAAKKEVKRLTVEAVETKGRVWKHKGQEMKQGDTAEVTERQAARLKEQGLVK